MARTIELRETYTIRGLTPQACFDYLADLDNATEWNSFITGVDYVAPVEVGTTLDARINFIISFGVQAEVTTHSSPDQLALTARRPLTAEIGADFAEDPAGTRFTYFFRMPPTKFFPVPSAVLKRLVKVQFDKDGEQLRGCLQGLA